MSGIISDNVGRATGLIKAAGGGKLLQVQSAIYASSTSSTTDSYIDTGLADTITCSATSSKVLVIVMINGVGKYDANIQVYTTLNRDIGGAGYTQLDEMDGVAGYDGATGRNFIGTVGMTYLDSPSSTSELTYKAMFKAGAATGYVQYNSAASSITLIEIGA